MSCTSALSSDKGKLGSPAEALVRPRYRLFLSSALGLRVAWILAPDGAFQLNARLLLVVITNV